MRSVQSITGSIVLILFFLFPLGAAFARSHPPKDQNDLTDAMVQKYSSELEGRIKKYMFIIESMGFKLTELIIDTEAKGFATLIFQGKISITDKKFKELAQKYADEKKLMTILELIHERDKDASYSVAPTKIVITTTTPPGVRIHFK